MIPNAAAQHPVDAPHFRLHIPAQRAGAIEIVAGTVHPFRLNVEHIPHADGSLDRDGLRERIVGLGTPAVTVEKEADISRFIRRHQQTDDHPLPGIGAEYRRGRVTVGLGAEHLVDNGELAQAVEEPLRAVVVPLFAGVLVVRSTVAALLAVLKALFRCFDQVSVFVQQTDAVVGKQDELPEGLLPRRGDDGLLPVILLHGADAAVIRCRPVTVSVPRRPL